jgi:hypothetical protein
MSKVRAHLTHLSHDWKKIPQCIIGWSQKIQYTNLAMHVQFHKKQTLDSKIKRIRRMYNADLFSKSIHGLPNLLYTLGMKATRKVVIGVAMCTYNNTHLYFLKKFNQMYMTTKSRHSSYIPILVLETWWLLQVNREAHFNCKW